MNYLRFGRNGRFVILLLLLVLTLSAGQEADTETNGDSNNEGDESTPQTNETPAEKAPKVEDEEPAFLAADPDKWGPYYDPQSEFCGMHDCYSILGFDYESGSPNSKDITRHYRRLSRKWHPDKSKHPNAKERFVKIARAYEVLTNFEKRREYDYMRYNQEAYYQKYGTSVLWTYAPKSDVTAIILVLLVVANLFSWFAQKTKWQNVADRLVKAAAEEWSASQGGTPESKELREHALAVLAEREKEENGEETTNGDDKASASPAASKKKAKTKKVSGKEKKKQELEALMPILKELVEEMEDFGGGFHKPTWKDLMIVSLAKLPYRIAVGTFWEAKYYANRLQGKELSDEEKDVLTERAVGPVAWDIASDETRELMIKRELWIMNNLIEWKEEQEIKNLSAWEQKAIKKAQKAEKKKAKLS
ncbi:DnaJ homolog subfamily C member 25 [Seminavis robusta]|uniref:DnaJ homolog subfamily C member 25 n=1 Tax=Seminavis robusta TaxID=568900 RepID=A0A9N8EA03_9STRA|nr:DnaJ homolog subfamily C member 25 [Seminavis robusta]|eukprot:Sro865_g212740.1 DnaJ homolog subfamily C member 25 (420) ;mRNA; r:1549-2923